MELKNRTEMDPKFMWDLSHIFKDKEAWEKAYAEASEAVQTVAAIKGTLGNSAESFKAGLDAVAAASGIVAGMLK